MSAPSCLSGQHESPPLIGLVLGFLLEAVDGGTAQLFGLKKSSRIAKWLGITILVAGAATAAGIARTALG